jgi:spore maturation protein CgeB
MPITMGFKLLTITSLYAGYLSGYYRNNSLVKNKPFREQYAHLLNDTSEPVGSYTKMFNKLGISAECIIENAQPLQRQWALENGLKSYSGKQLIFKQIEKFRPDVLWLENIELTEKTWIDNVRASVPEIRLIISSHCAPYNSRIIERFKNLDFIITCTPGLKSIFEQEGMKAYLVYHAFNPDVLKKISAYPPAPVNDLVFSGSFFMGSGYHDERLELVEKILKQDIDIRIYGNLESKYKIKAKNAVFYAIQLLTRIKMSWIIKKIPLLNRYEDYGSKAASEYSGELIRSVNPPLFGIDMFKLLSNAKITLNIHGSVAGDYAGNMRIFEATGAGSCLLTDSKKNMKDLFNCNKEVVVYEGYDDCIEKIKWLLDNENERAEIAKEGQKRTLEAHSVEERCKLLIDIITRELSNLKYGLPDRS